jgi:hypothetical protein
MVNSKRSELELSEPHVINITLEFAYENSGKIQKPKSQ